MTPDERASLAAERRLRAIDAEHKRLWPRYEETGNERIFQRYTQLFDEYGEVLGRKPRIASPSVDYLVEVLAL